MTARSTSDPAGSVYPPRDIYDIAFYEQIEVYAGYLSQESGDPIPGPNRSPAYRWGATNRVRDRQVDDDGFDNLRRSYLVVLRASH